MKQYVVRWAEVAVQDLERLVESIRVDSPQAARKTLMQLEKRAKCLETFPLRGRVVPELAYFELQTYRETIVKPYRMIYRVGDSDVLVIAVFDGRRDLADILLWRLLEL